MRACASWMRNSVLGLVIFLSFSANLFAAERLHNIAVASSMRHVWSELIGSFGEDLPVTFGASGNLTEKILRGAPFAVLLAADMVSIERLEAKQILLQPGLAYARGRLVAVSSVMRLPDMIDGERLRHLIDEGYVQRVALANPRHAPYGMAAIDFLETLPAGNLDFQRIVGENASQAMQFVLTEAADIGLVPEALTYAAGIRDSLNISPIETSRSTDVVHGMAVMLNADDVAQRFYVFMQSTTAASILQRYGFNSP